MIHKNMSLREAASLARELGCQVFIRRGTGDLIVAHPAIPKSLKINCRKKDAGLTFVSYLRRLAKAA